MLKYKRIEPVDQQALSDQTQEENDSGGQSKQSPPKNHRKSLTKRAIAPIDSGETDVAQNGGSEETDAAQNGGSEKNPKKIFSGLTLLTLRSAANMIDNQSLAAQKGRPMAQAQVHKAMPFKLSFLLFLNWNFALRKNYLSLLMT